ncbi:MAG: hypothetical protein ACR2NO_09815 [Chloroflexota bacterium]
MHPVYHALADAAGDDYWFVVGASTGESEIHVPVGELLATLDEALAAAPGL